MVLFSNFKHLRLASSLFSYTFASKPKRFVSVDPNPSNFSLPNLLYRPFTSKISETQHHFTVNYLINSCGLSPEGAVSASKIFKLRSPENADSVLALLRNHGLSETQISKVFRSAPKILQLDPQKILLPKIEFFSSLGISREDLAKALARKPNLLVMSLRNRIRPTYDFLRSMLLSEKNVVTVIKRSSWIFVEGHRKQLVRNVGLLRELGMPQTCIAFLLTHCSSVLMLNPEKLGKLVGEVKEMGINVENTTFANALHTLCGNNKLVWNRSCEAYKKWGWSEDDVLSAFKRCPSCMIMSEQKLMQTMDFLVNKMGWSSGMIAKYPVVTNLSLERRLIPRCSVVKVLLLKGLINENFNLGSVVIPAEKQFLETFVNRYLGKVPQLLNVYQGKVDIQDA
ncbi:hypothetical protein D8674_021014 [Pyrus ussuriensis x Pyrus communis]|uniref:Uncharacterized protein n=1 Tax=Pyrus ussuriensis x Pyrus communis TaxID=2448454 RepID=A0A5N5HHB0_9ROSA|nr:hypothetical protein D8674_021014 [Pyrus ussuriensis x Pyrus communis]